VDLRLLWTIVSTRRRFYSDGNWLTYAVISYRLVSQIIFSDFCGVC